MEGELKGKISALKSLSIDIGMEVREQNRYRIMPSKKKTVLRIRIHVGSGAFVTPGSRLGKKSGSWIRIRDERSGSYFRELRNNILG
jgi:hypothetical protein